MKRSIRAHGAILFAAMLLTSIVGGCCFPNREACLALQDSWGKLRPATEFGIMSNPSLDADSKVTRMRLVTEFGNLIDDMVQSTAEENASAEEEK